VIPVQNDADLAGAVATFGVQPLRHLNPGMEKSGSAAAAFDLRWMDAMFCRHLREDLFNSMARHG
jgi:hypothetical protein